jgi:FKBP-type peptidyl-prolyl cis-trans isomerase
MRIVEPLRGDARGRRWAMGVVALGFCVMIAGCEEARSSRAHRRLDVAESRFDSLEARVARLERAVGLDSVATGAQIGSAGGGAITTPSGLAYTVVRQGSGRAAESGRHVTIHETTTFADGRTLYSTREGEPLRFLLGGKQVIDGLDEGVTGMRVGERRTMVVPPALSRRTAYPDGLSPDDTLHYDVELVGVEEE